MSLVLRRTRSAGQKDSVDWRMRCALLVAALAISSLPATAARTVRVAICQILSIDSDREGNFRRVEYALETARAAGAVIAAFPQSVILGWENPDAHRLATPIPGADSERIAALAKKYGLMISIGVDETDGDRLYDSAILVDRNGRLLWKHRKLTVLPELMDPPYAQGTIDGIGAVETEWGRVGMLICADTFGDDYAERIRTLSPDLVLIPYGWAAEMDKWPGHAKSLESLVVRRAKQWEAPVVATNLVGVMTHGPWKGQTFGGASLVVDASGTILTTLRDRDVDVRVLDIPLRSRVP
jgi:predicted amidohydrolase